MKFYKLLLVSAPSCGTYCSTNCTCVSNCTSVCSKVCEAVGACSGHWSTPANPILTVTYWTAFKAVIDNWLTHFGFSASPAAPSVNARILASDWNTKVRDPLNQNTQTYPGLATNSLGVATAVSGDAVAKSGLRPSDVVAKLNTRRCTTVYGSKVYSTCNCNIYTIGCGDCG